VKAEVILERRRHVPEHVDVSSSAEKFLTRARDHNHLNSFVHARVENRAIELLHHFIAVCVRGRIVERDYRDTVYDLVIEFRFGLVHN
jgi:hypothetical protein